MKIAIIAGIHEDIKNLEKALEMIKGVQCDEIVSLGDIVGYSVPFFGFYKSRHAHKCVDLVKQMTSISIVGNHDLFAIEKLPKERGFDYPENWYSIEYADRIKIGKDKVWIYHDELPAILERQDFDYLSTLSEYHIEKYLDETCMFSHYVKPNLVGDTQFVIEQAEDLTDHFDFMNEYGVKYSFVSHDWIEGLRFITASKIDSLGYGKFELPSEPTVIGVPWVANGTPSNGFVIVDTETNEIECVPLNSKPHIVPDWYER